jgi:hypothetical protein
MSGFFASIPAAEWPHRFELVASEDGLNVNNSSVRIHELLFRILHHEPISFPCSDLVPPEKLLLEVTELAKIYDCQDHVKDQVVAKLYSFGGQKIVAHADILLKIANNVRNERLFLYALRHVVGQTLQRGEDFGSLDDGLYKVVKKSAEDLQSRVQKVCNSLYLLKAGITSSDFIAFSVSQRYLLTHLATKRLASGEMLATFKKLASGVKLLQALGLGWVEDDAATISAAISPSTQDARTKSILGLNKAEALQPTPDKIRSALRKLASAQQKEIQSLKDAHADSDYFTCAELKGTYPWEDTERPVP